MTGATVRVEIISTPGATTVGASVHVHDLPSKSKVPPTSFVPLEEKSAKVPSFSPAPTDTTQGALA